jgi:hypothetical protein
MKYRTAVPVSVGRAIRSWGLGREALVRVFDRLLVGLPSDPQGLSVPDDRSPILRRFRFGLADARGAGDACQVTFKFHLDPINAELTQVVILAATLEPTP